MTSEAWVAVSAWNLLANGMGGIDWAGLPYVVELLGIDDVPALMEAMRVIRSHKPDQGDGDKGVQSPAQGKGEDDGTGDVVD